MDVSVMRLWATIGRLYVENELLREELNEVKTQEKPTPSEEE